MSHIAYDLQLSDALNDLHEQYKVEQIPSEQEKELLAMNKEERREYMFQHYSSLYIKYIDIFRKLEECYDQMVHPQKRVYIKKVLETSILRICELKSFLIINNPKEMSIYVQLDSLLFDQKYDPSVIEMPIPRYFKEDDRIEILEEWKEYPELLANPPGKRKLAPKEKPGAKKKKKKKKIEEKPEPPIFLDEKTLVMDHALDKFNAGGNKPEYEKIFDPVKDSNVSIIDAIMQI
jgi:hypothetical protein